MQTKQTSSPELKTVEAQCSKDPFQEILDEAAALAHRYLQTIGERRVGVPQEAIDRLPALGGALPSQGQDPKSVLRLLDEIGSPATIATTGGRLFGGVIGGALPTTVAAHWLADAWDQNACLFDLLTCRGRTSRTWCLAGLLDLLGLPSTSGGAFVTGTQMANVTALAAARHALLHKIGWDVEGNGLFCGTTRRRSSSVRRFTRRC